jgi:hypothetical protein
MTTQSVGKSTMSRKSLIDQYGSEVMLRCKCGDVPSHAMDMRVPRCPVCREITEIIYGENWEEIRKKHE